MLIAASALIELAFLGGCNFAPTYKVPPVPTPQSYKENVGWKLAQPSDNVIRGKWWEMFGDPQLNALEVQVALSNQTVQAALATVQEARSIVREARSQYFPTITAEPSVSKTWLSNNANTIANSSTITPASKGSSHASYVLYTLPLDASWEPDLWGAIRNTVRADIYSAQSSAANLGNVLLSAQADLAVDYYSLRGQDALKAVLDATVVADLKSLDLTKALFAQGVDSDEDVAEAETQLANVQVQDTNLGIQRAQLEHAIALLLGKSASTFTIPVDASITNFAVHPPEIPLGIPSELLERRPDIAASERTVAAANAQIGVARAAFFPTLTLAGSGGFESVSLANLLSGPSAFASLGATAAQTVFDAGLRNATVQQYRAAHNVAVANYRQTVLSAFQEVEDNLAALRVLSHEWEQADQAVRSAQRTLNLSLHRYELGIDSYLNVITAQTTLLNNQQTAVNLRTEQMTYSVQLIMTLGGGWDSSQLSTPSQPASKKSP